MTDPVAPSSQPRTFADHVVDYAQAGWPCILPVPAREALPPIPIAEFVALYRHVDRRGELLYVGITSDPARRWEQHAETSLWARFVAATYIQWFPYRLSARRAEKAAIRHEEPIFNTARPNNGREVSDRKIRYLRTGSSGLLRRVPCREVPGDFCVMCGPDQRAYLDSIMAEAIL